MRVVAFHRGAPERGKRGRRKGRGASASANSDISQMLRDYCAANDHRLIEIIAPERGYWDAAELAQNYRRLLELVSPPNGRPAMILIPDSTHLADALDGLVERLIELEALECQPRCVDNELPHPLQNAEVKLDLRGGESQQRGVQIRQSLAAAAAQGAVLGRTPYGYRQSADGKLSVDEREANIVRTIFGLYTGVGGERAPIGLRQIAHALNSHRSRTRHERPWTPTAILNILKNRVYTGAYVRCGMRIVGNHAALISTAIFNQAHAILRERRPARAKAATREHFLMSGLVYCGACGNSMVGITRKRQWTNADGEKMEKAYRYYECALKRDGAAHHTLPSELLHRKVIRWVAKLGKRHTQALQKAYAAEFATETHDADEQARRAFVNAVRSVARGYGSLRDLQPLLSEYRAAESQRQNGAANPNGANAPAAAPTSPALNAIFDAGANARGLNRLLRAVLDRVEVDGRKDIAFHKRELSLLAR